MRDRRCRACACLAAAVAVGLFMVAGVLAAAGDGPLLRYAGSYETDELLAEVAVAEALALLGAELPHLLRNLDVRGSVDLVSGVLLVEGNARHGGTQEEAVVCIHPHDGSVSAAILSGGTITIHSPVPDYAAQPRCIKDWITQANSGHRDRLVAPTNVRIASTPALATGGPGIRLRSSAAALPDRSRPNTGCGDSGGTRSGQAFTPPGARVPCDRPATRPADRTAFRSTSTTAPTTSAHWRYRLRATARPHHRQQHRAGCAEPGGDPAADECLDQVGSEHQDPSRCRHALDRVLHLHGIRHVDAAGKRKKDGVEPDQREIDNCPNDESCDHGGDVAKHGDLSKGWFGGFYLSRSGQAV